MAKRQVLNQEFLALYYQADISEIKRCLAKTANIHKTTATKVTKIVIDATEIKLGLLPYEMIIPMITELPIKSILALCETSRRFAAICDDNRVWKFLLKRDYNIEWAKKEAREEYIRRYNFSPMISCGADFIGFITTEGELYMWGDNHNDQLGRVIDSTIADFKTHCILRVSIEKIMWGQVSCGYYHTGAVTTDGELYMWGNNDYGQLGNSVTFNKKKPIKKKIKGNPKISQVSCGNNHTGAITEDGRLYMWGWNDHGQLGDNTVIYTFTTSLIKIKGNPKIVQVSCGRDRTYAVTESGRLYAWGDNFNDHLGTETPECKMVKKPTRVNIKGNQRIIQVSCGGSHAGAITEDGELYMWGWNEYGQLGDGSKISKKKPVKIKIKGNPRITQVACGGTHTGAVTESGKLYTWGNNSGGQLGNGTHVRKRRPVYIMEEVIQVSCGRASTGVVTIDGKPYTWGHHNLTEFKNIPTEFKNIPTGKK